MRSAPMLATEDQRLAALAQFGLSGGESDAGLDELVALTKRIFDVPIVLVSLVERHRQFFPARIGLDVCETEREISFCAHALGSSEVFVVPDARVDPRFADNPLVTAAPGIRFYAGAPLRSGAGHDIGTLCLIDTQPHNGLSEVDARNLKALAALVLDRLEMRRLDRASEVGQSRFESIAATSPDGIICADREGRISFWNNADERLFGFTAAEALGAALDLIVPPRLRGGHGHGLKRIVAGGAPTLVGKTVELVAARKDGSEFPIELSLSMWHEHGEISFGAIIRDITERRANEDRLYNLAHLDTLTGLLNRSVLIDRLAELGGDDPATLLMIDLDGFKDINDTLGHNVGDSVLRQIAGRITAATRPTDTAVRLGGDEFAILLPGRASPVAAAATADRIIATIAEPLDGLDARVGASIGIAFRPLDGGAVEDLISAADLAMYQAKNEGRGCHRFFVPALREAAFSRHAFEGELRRALEQGEFTLFYQPQVRISDGALLGAEALLRWEHPEAGMLDPDRFLASLENGPLAAEVGRWVMETACAQAGIWRARLPNFRIGVNLFSAQFRTGTLEQDVLGVLARYGLPPEALELEINENTILRHDDTMLRPLRALRKHGVGVTLDDFGTGEATLSVLKRYPLTRIKIDRGFVAEICDDPFDAALVNAMVYLGNALGVGIIAEGVETAAQRDLLRSCGCDAAQGYLFGRPVPAADFMPAIEPRRVGAL